MTSRTLYADETAAAVFTPATVADLAPFTDPINHLPDLFFHSENDYYALAQTPTVVTVTHPAQGPSSAITVLGIPAAHYSMVYYYDEFDTDFQLCTHSLGAIPHYIAADANGYSLPNAFPIQTNSGGHRTVSTYATTADIRLQDRALPGNNVLAAVSKTYTVYVFKTPAADPLKPVLLIDIPNGSVIFGQGKFDTAYQMLRRKQAGETTDVYIPPGRMTDIAGGQARFIQQNGTVTDTSGTFRGNSYAYNGSYAGVTNIEARVV